MKNGYENERDMINYLNGKRKGEVHILFQELLEKLYPNIKNDDVITAYKYGKFAKCDMVIVVNGLKKGISIKCGFKNSVHVETIDSFLKYLKKFNFSQTDKLARYLYSDGSNNNTGNSRISTAEYKTTHEKEIKSINELLNDPELKSKLIYRFLICADINYSVKVDAFIYGTLYNFLWLTTDEVLDYLLKNNIESSGVHVSSLFIQEWNKNLNYNPKYEFCRSYIQVKWYSLMEDTLRIMCERYK